MKNFNLGHGILHFPLKLPWSPPGFVNIYLIEDDDGYIMIDCGVNGDEYFEDLKMNLNNLNIQLSDIKLLIGTHLHSDHVGLSTVLRNEGIKFGLYKNAPDFIPRYNDWSSRFKAIGEYAKKQGAPKDFLDDMNSITTPTTTGKITPPEILFDEGKIKDIDRDLQVIFTPGHDISEISILDTSSKIIFSGDHVLPRITPFIPLHDEDTDMLSNYVNSLEKVNNIDHEKIAPGHFEVIDSPQNRIEQILLHHEKRSKKIIGILSNGALTGWEVTQSLFSRPLDSWNLRMAFQETMAHLKYIESQGIIKQNGSKKITWEVI